MAIVTVGNQHFEGHEGETILDLLEREGISPENLCGAIGKCGNCMVRIVKGEENITPLTFKEKQLLGNVFFITHERLACQTKLLGDVTIKLVN